ncbi:MAG: hypothetical protein QNJ92_16265 [Alphaproteobacteria bacterium]|nr:hypothetical protein [Alphaproteobacteria bacterium]
MNAEWQQRINDAFLESLESGSPADREAMRAAILEELRPDTADGLLMLQGLLPDAHLRAEPAPADIQQEYDEALALDPDGDPLRALPDALGAYFVGPDGRVYRQTADLVDPHGMVWVLNQLEDRRQFDLNRAIAEFGTLPEQAGRGLELQLEFGVGAAGAGGGKPIRPLPFRKNSRLTQHAKDTLRHVKSFRAGLLKRYDPEVLKLSPDEAFKRFSGKADASVQSRRFRALAAIDRVIEARRRGFDNPLSDVLDIPEFNGKVVQFDRTNPSKPIERQLPTTIDFNWGKPGTRGEDLEDGGGIAKILTKHGAEAAEKMTDLLARVVFDPTGKKKLKPGQVRMVDARPIDARTKLPKGRPRWRIDADGWRVVLRERDGRIVPTTAYRLDRKDRPIHVTRFPGPLIFGHQ